MSFLRALNAAATHLGRGSSSLGSTWGRQVWWFNCSARGFNLCQI